MTQRAMEVAMATAFFCGALNVRLPGFRVFVFQGLGCVGVSVLGG